MASGGAPGSDPTIYDVGTTQEFEQQLAQELHRVCKARPNADPPEDCDWPFCGCDEHASRVLAHIQECDMHVIDGTRWRDVLIGGNHLANLLITLVGPDFAERLPPDLDPQAALRLLHADQTFDVWCAWAAIMRARGSNA